jgi:translation initiation factor 2B subunit (eIF-2B alpha/beta/delta family)
LCDKWTKELSLVSEHYIGKSNQLEFINLQIPISLFSSSGDAQTAIELLDKVQQLNSKLVNSQTKFGLDFNTAMLHPIMEKNHLETAAKNIGNLINNTNNTSFSCASIAVNVHTFHNAQVLSASLHQHFPQFDVLGTEILRCDSKRPGQISANYDYHPKHRLEKSDTSTSTDAGYEQAVSKEEAELIANIHQATTDFQRALDVCIQTEKILLEKVSTVALL